MSGTLLAGSYATLVRQPAVVRTFVPALVGRLAYGVLPLSLLFTVQHSTGSFAVAATAMALNGLATLSMPLKSRLIDRHGQRLVLPPITASMVAVLVLAAAMAHHEVASAVPWLATGLAVGLASPPLGPCMRAQWRALVTEEWIARAYSLDAVAEEALYLIGPMIAAGLLAVAPAYAGLLVCPALLLVGAAGLAASPAAVARTGQERRRTTRGPLRHAAFRRLLLVMAAVGGVTAMIYTVTAARALAVGAPSLAGLADAGVAVGSVVGGLVWGRADPAWTWDRAVARLLALLGLAAAVASALDPFWLFSVALAAGGMAIAPIFVVAYQASDRLVDPAEVTEASTWVTTVSNLGVSLGAAGAGVLVGLAGARSPGWVGAALALTVAAAVAVAPRVAARRTAISRAPAVRRRRG